MNVSGLVSIITPNWNCSELLCQTIKSIQKQTYENWELLIQDDCSTDNVENVILATIQVDERIKFDRNKTNSGAAITRNNALLRARGKWIAFLDSDDLWEPTKLEKQLNFMLENDYHFSYTAYREINSDGQDTGVLISGPNHLTKLGVYAFCWPGCLTVMYDREYYGLLQIKDIKKNNDYAMWLQLIQKMDCYLLNEVLAKYRRGRYGSVSSHSYFTMIKWHYKLWHDVMDKNGFSSLFWTGINIVCGVYKKFVYVK